MFREIIIPQETKFTLEFPKEFIGHKVEVIAFTLKDNSTKSAKNDKLNEAIHFWNSINIDFTGFKFNREEAYER